MQNFEGGLKVGSKKSRNRRAVGLLSLQEILFGKNIGV
jgi:hypothetical protein